MAITLLPAKSLAVDLDGEHLIMRFESFSPNAIIPVPGDPPTIGYGTTGPDIHMGMVWTEPQAMARLYQDVNRAAAALRGLILTPTSQQQFDAMLSLAYNVGAGALHGSHLIAYHNQQMWSAAASQFPLWDHAHGRVVQGLENRREAESTLYREGSPA